MCEDGKKQHDLMNAAFEVAEKEVGFLDRGHCTRKEFQEWNSRWKASYEQACERLKNQKE